MGWCRFEASVGVEAPDELEAWPAGRAGAASEQETRGCLLCMRCGVKGCRVLQVEREGAGEGVSPVTEC